MSLVSVRDAIVTTVATKLPTLKTCRAHHGNIDENELRQFFDVLPAILVVCLGVKSVSNEAGVNIGDVRFGAFVVTTRVHGKARDDAALVLVDAMLKLAANERWGIDEARRSKSVTADNLYSGQIDKKALALWLVSWDQGVPLPEDIGELVPFETFSGGVDMAPAEGTTDVSVSVTLPQE